MKKLLYISISAILLFGFSACYKTCEDPFAPNYTLEGSCIDLTASITGTYSGQYLDSIVGLHSSTSNLTLVITKVDDSHVTVSSSGTSSYISYQAAVSASSNGYYLTVASQTSNGLTVSGAGTYFGQAADGVYITSTKQMTVYALAGTQYEGFAGTQQ